MDKMETAIMFFLGLGRFWLGVLFVSLAVGLYIYLSDMKIAEKRGDIVISIISLCLSGVVLFFVNGYAVQFKLDKSEALLEEAKEAYYNRKPNKAITLLNQSIDLDNNNAEALFYLGVLYLNKGDSKLKAKELLQRASSLGHKKAGEILEELD